MQNWYALHTKPRKEYFVRRLLESRGYETYMPVLRLARKGRRHEVREEPFFARYLFMRADFVTVPLSSINWMPGVVQVVSFGGQPAVVGDRVIEWLKARLASMTPDGYDSGMSLRPNERLRVTGGPLKGMEALFDRRLSAEGRARVFIEMLGRPVACQIELEYLQPIC